MAYFNRGTGYLKWAVLALVLAILSLCMARILAPFRRGWLKLGGLLAHVINPLVIGLIFVVVVVPCGALMRLFGRDPLSLKWDAAKPTYWVSRKEGLFDGNRLKDQF
jgi:Saxitoxin biosynthesis operon protein SxtJ